MLQTFALARVSHSGWIFCFSGWKQTHKAEVPKGKGTVFQGQERNHSFLEKLFLNN